MNKTARLKKNNRFSKRAGECQGVAQRAREGAIIRVVSPTIRRCYLDPHFPKQLYLGVYFVLAPDGFKLLIPLTILYTNLEDLRLELAQIATEYNQSPEIRYQVPETALVYVLSLAKLFPLKPEYWERPARTIRYRHSEQRIRDFIPASDPGRHRILVAPHQYSRKTGWQFSAIKPFALTEPDSAIDAFLRRVDWPVDIRAKYAAIYGCVLTRGFNWKTGEWQEPQDKKHSVN